MAMFGLDIEQVRNLSRQMQADADQIKDLISRLSSQLEGVQWVGPDSDKFRSDWQGSMVPALNNVATALLENSQRAAKNAEQQEAASA